MAAILIYKDVGSPVNQLLRLREALDRGGTSYKFGSARLLAGVLRRSLRA
jgi:hypothetical protein